ncbi:hypothetical protein [Halocatena marina]|uniref:Uncharacterized protein n=1 Tax=Halocatena marina TaxID=2934937 RepID=A0ABD5YIC2_9EURY|nr:hypothetical protein [Halocatena marina]
MTNQDSAVRRRKILWSSIGIGGFSVTGWTYFNVGFVPSFLPLLIGIVALRRLFAIEMAESPTEDALTDRYDVDSEQEYTDDEQVDILSEVKGEFTQKGRIWAVLGASAGIIGVVATSQSLALMVVCIAVTVYCLVRYVRIRRLLRTLDTRIDELVG